MSPAKCLMTIALATLVTACSERSRQTTTPLQADVTTCTGNEDAELIGDALYSDPNGIQPGEYVASYERTAGGVEPVAGGMFYRPGGGGKAPWGALTTQRSNSATQPEQHDIDGDGQADSGECEAHLVPNGVYAITFRRPAGGAPTFTRSVAMLDEFGFAENVVGSGVYQDVHVLFDLATPTSVTMTGDFKATQAYRIIDPEESTWSGFTLNPDPIVSPDTLWFASTYTPTAAVGGTPAWLGNKRAVLNSYNFDYDRNVDAFGPTTNSFPNLNISLPVAHIFAAPGTSSVFTVRVRTVLPFHLGIPGSAGILMPQTMTVTVEGDSVDFSTSAAPTTNQPVTFTSATMGGEEYFEYFWDFGDNTSSGWSSGYKQIQHTYASEGPKTVTLSVRRFSGEGPTVSTPQTVTVVDPPLSVSIRVAAGNQNGAIRQNETCLFWGDAVGGNGVYTHTWYKGSVEIASGNPLERNVGNKSFSLKVVVHSGSQTAEATKAISVTANGQFCF